MSARTSARSNSTDAPRKVFMVRAPSGVTKIMDRALGVPDCVGGVA